MRINPLQAGFSLVEVMVTGFIFATALMGAVAVQGVAKRSSFEAQQRTVASYLANDIVERLRLNKQWLLATISSGSYQVSGIGDASQTAPSCSQSDGGMLNCSGSSLNQHDLYQWEQLMLGANVDVGGANFPVLTSPLGCLVVDSSGLMGVIISWVGRDAEVDAEEVRTAQLGRINDTQLNALMASVSDFDAFAENCGLTGQDRHVYGVVSMIQ